MHLIGLYLIKNIKKCPNNSEVELFWRLMLGPVLCFVTRKMWIFYEFYSEKHETPPLLLEKIHVYLFIDHGEIQTK